MMVRTIFVSVKFCVIYATIALLGKLSSMADIDEEMESLSNSCSPSFPVEDREVAKIMSDATNSLEVQLGPQEDSIPYMVEASEPTPHSKPWRDSDFLPPGTITLKVYCLTGF